MLDRIDAGVGRGMDAAGAMGMGRDLEVHGMRHVADGLHLLVGEMLLEAHRAGIEHAAGGHELDDVDAGRGELAHDLLALLRRRCRRRGLRCASFDGRGELRRKPGRRVGMSADDRERRRPRP